MPPPPVSTNNASAAAPPSRSRPQASRKRAHPPGDDAAYHGVSASHLAGVKRTAADRADGEPRLKRKRIEPLAATAERNAGAIGTKESEANNSLIDFNALPTEALHRYLSQFDIVPEVDPLPTTAQDPPHPSSLLHTRAHGHGSTASPPPQSLPITPANRPRREPSASVNRTRRSSRLLEDDGRQYLMPVVADSGEIHTCLAQIAARHCKDYSVKEVDTLAAFMCTVKAKGERQFCIRMMARAGRIVFVRAAVLQVCDDWMHALLMAVRAKALGSALPTARIAGSCASGCRLSSL
ncbi:hypothetical protein EIP86_006373 [Pleurotus ostreatoroseus]|nr:hypothetical protein EIP86_006373 [Pleurotus ostreatoroseus]